MDFESFPFFPLCPFLFQPRYVHSLFLSPFLLPYPLLLLQARICAVVLNPLISPFLHLFHSSFQLCITSSHIFLFQFSRCWYLTPVYTPSTYPQTRTHDTYTHAHTTHLHTPIHTHTTQEQMEICALQEGYMRPINPSPKHHYKARPIKLSVYFHKSRIVPRILQRGEGT